MRRWRTGDPFANVPVGSSRWDPVADSEEGHYTHYIYPAAWFRLDFRLWWREYRFVLMAAVPWSLTWREYVERYRYWQELYEALGRAPRGGEPVGNRGTQANH